MGIHKSRFFFNDKSYEKIALGGIDDKNLNLLKLTNFSGIAAINYFKKNTEIYKGMKLIDDKLGGTTPLEIIL